MYTLYSASNDGKSGNINNVYIFSIVAAFILAIALHQFREPYNSAFHRARQRSRHP